jgi:hypothetical protein
MKMTTAIYEASKLGYNLELQETEHPEIEDDTFDLVGTGWYLQFPHGTTAFNVAYVHDVQGEEFYGQHFGFHNNLQTAFNELIERAKQGAPS